MTISATVIADSVSQDGMRLTTLQLRYPRFVHAEFMTHRVFSRNASSSRAVPVERLIADVRRDPAQPIHWGKNQPGMQAREQLDGAARERAMFLWKEAMESALCYATRLQCMGVHKQIVNRLLEPFSHINVLVSGTEWTNFQALRDHPDAQPEMRELATRIATAMYDSVRKPLGYGDWHLPYVLEAEKKRETIPTCIKLSVARCARVSYLTHEGNVPDVDKDLALYERLVGATPLHASPTEHQATPDVRVVGSGSWLQPHYHGNFYGWVQYRKTLQGEEGGTRTGV